MGEVGTFSVYGIKLHLICATNRIPVAYELTAANVAEALLARELLTGANLPMEDSTVRRLLGDLAYRSGMEHSRKSWPDAACC